MAGIELASAVVRVSLDASRVFVAMNALRAGMEREFLRLATSLTLASVGVRAAFLGLRPLKEVVSAAAAFEQTRVQFEALLGSAERGRALLAEIIEFARVAPAIGLEETEAAARQLLAFNFALEDVIPLLVMAGKVSAGTGAKIDEVAHVFGKINTDMRAMRREINQLADRGIPLYAKLAAVMKVASDRLSTMSRKGEIGLSDVLQVIKEMTTEGGLFATVLQEKSKTLLGTSELLSATFLILQRQIGKDFVEALRPLAVLASQILDLFIRLDAVTGSFAGELVVMTTAVMGISAAFHLLAAALKAAGIASITFASAFRFALKSTIIGLLTLGVLQVLEKALGVLLPTGTPAAFAEYEKRLKEFEPTKFGTLAQRGGEGGLRAGRESFLGLGKAVQDAMLRGAEPQRQVVQELRKIDRKAANLAEIRDLIKQMNAPFGVLK